MASFNGASALLLRIGVEPQRLRARRGCFNGASASLPRIARADFERRLGSRNAERATAPRDGPIEAHGLEEAQGPGGAPNEEDGERAGRGCEPGQSSSGPTREGVPGPPLGEPSQGHRDLPPAVLTVDEVAALLRVERKTVYAATARGEIPGVRRVGSRLRVSRDRVLAWLAQGQDRVSRSRRSP